ncbi:Predicted DNA-binding transcriptional regulator YafY, contains an HTH and WYL domains [Duganella sacchari]|uniref:Predicted DNA-binding transcriptional regulator YafY, contains an HTH and WYL domains n=1 Tax=Duganella sacchari TaxID=551987 RepID=A0A1M7L3A4_9BURK|nr:YafY family protein [Duganella sacchari]SHM72459.1 Predicted DNA-binding transcriptional regulator YafY, contains an HTH and WYL domains [Duganella sacchari]
MYHPTTRVLAVLELLQTHGRLSGADMAGRLAVDGRTLRRYIAMLEQLGIPIMAERGRHGGYALMPGFKLPPMMFTDDEAQALSLGLLAARGLGLAEAAPAVASAQAKLERIMPDGLRNRVSAMHDTVRLDLRSGLSRSAPPPDNAALGALSLAAKEGRRVRLHYRAAGVDSERDFDTYGLAYYGGYWYAVGYCYLRQDMRTFRLDRVTAVRATRGLAQRPPGFDALEHLRVAVATVPRKFAARVLLKTTLDQARRAFIDTIGLFEQCEHGVLLHNQSDELEWFARQLAAAPFEVEVLEPPALRTALRTIGERLLRMAAVR